MLFRCQFPVAFYASNLVICAVMVYGTLSSYAMACSKFFLYHISSAMKFQEIYEISTCAEIRKTTLLERLCLNVHCRSPTPVLLPLTPHSKIKDQHHKQQQQRQQQQRRRQQRQLVVVQCLIQIFY